GVGDLLARREAGIDDLHGAKALQRRFIIGEMLGLAAHRLFPHEAEPGEVLIDALLIFRAAAAGVDVLYAKEKAPAERLRRLIGEDRGIGMSQMQPAVRARCEAEDVALRPGYGHEDRTRLASLKASSL